MTFALDPLFLGDAGTLEIIESILSSGKLEEDSEQKLVEIIKQLKQKFNS